MRAIQLIMPAFLFCLIPAYTYACNMQQLSFGSSIDAVATAYQLDTLGANIYGETELVGRGTQLCDDLPSDSIAIFTFLYNQLVQVKLDRRNSKDTLLAFAKEHFDAPADTDDEAKTTRMFDPESPIQTVIYRVQRYREDEEEEMITITSKNHEALFKKIAKEQKSGIASDE